MRRLGGAAVAGLAALAIGPGAATLLSAQAYELGQSSQIVPSERLRIFAYGRALGQGAATAAQTEQLQQDMMAQGFYHDASAPAVVFASLTVQPTLGYDPNINGGYQQTGFSLGGLYFEATPESLARGGVALGFDADASYRLAWDNGRFLSLDVFASAVHVPQLGEGTQNAGLALCSRNHLAGWSFADLCHSRSYAWFGGGHSEATTTELALTGLYDASTSYHEMKVVVGTRDDRQIYAGLAAVSVWPDVVTQAAITLSAPVPEALAPRVRLSGELRWSDDGRLTALGIWHEMADGTDFLGVARQDATLGLSLSHELTPAMTVMLQAVHNDSSITLFNTNELSANVIIDLRKR